MSEPVTSPVPARGHRRLKRVLAWIAGSVAFVLVVATVGGYLIYRHLNGNLTHRPVVFATDHPRPPKEPGKAENILLIGSDTRAFKGGAAYGAEIGGARSDTTIVVHISADGKHAVLVSIPRDTYAHIPSCQLTKTTTSQPEWNKFNVAFSVGGPSCTIALVENMTHLRIDHFVEVNFAGFKKMVDALGGVRVCLTHAIDDPVRTNPATGGTVGSGLVVDSGWHTFDGKEALGFVRARYAVGDGSDLGRIKNQQTFLSAVIRKAESTKLLFHPLSLYRFLDAATKSIETDPGFGLGQLKSLAGKLHGLTAGKVSLLTVPLENLNAYVDIGGLQQSVVYWDKPRAHALFAALRNDQPLPGTEPKPAPSATPTPTPLIVAPAQIHVRVLNGTEQKGLAHQVAAQLQAKGFIVDDITDADASNYTTSIVRYGLDKVESSQTLAASVNGAQRQRDATLGSTLELIVGSDFTGVRSVTISTPTSTPTPSLDIKSAQSDVCTV